MRKEKTITIDDRGTPLTFRIVEMPATQLESWIMRVLLLLGGSGAQVPEGGLACIGSYISKHGLAVLGQVDFDKAKPLLDELLSCCHRRVGSAEEQVRMDTADAYIQDVSTLFKLRMEALQLNVAFFSSAAQSDTPDLVTIARPRRTSGA